MRNLLRILGLISGLVYFTPASFALETRYSENILVSMNETIGKDMAAAASTIQIRGTIDGDLMAVAQSILVDGNINQDLTGLAERVDIDGVVKDDLRVACQYLTIDGSVGDEIVAGCGDLVIGEGARIGSCLIAGCEKAAIYGELKDKVRIWADTIEVAGAIQGDADLCAEKILILPSALITGNLNYKSKNEAEIQKGARVLGQVNRKRVEIEPAEKTNGIINTASILFKILYFVAALIIGIIIISLSKRNARLINDTIVSSFWKCLGSGFLFLISLPFAAIILAITLVGIPLSIFAVVGYIIAIYLSHIFVSLSIGKVVLGALKKGQEVSLIFSLIIGMVILTILVNIPYIGWILGLTAILAGIGALLISRIKLYTEMREKGII